MRSSPPHEGFRIGANKGAAGIDSHAAAMRVLRKGTRSMAKKRLVTQFGMGTSIRSRNYTEAAARAIRDALWHNSLNVAEAFGFPREAMIIDVEIGVQRPEEVDRDALLKIFPYGRPAVTVVKGGLDIPKQGTDRISVVANAAVVVSFDMEATND
jgi:uncharacterized protein (TIGR02058 family)